MIKHPITCQMTDATFSRSSLQEMNEFNVLMCVELQVKLDEVEQMALKGGKKELHKLEGRVSAGHSAGVCVHAGILTSICCPKCWSVEEKGFEPVSRCGSSRQS